jgi:hypothetical protein
MNIGLRIFALLMFFLVYGTVNAADFRASAEAAIRAIYHDGTIEQVAIGDVDSDGLDDAAYVINWYDPSKGHELVVGVLRGRRDGTFVAWTHTKRFEMGQRPPEIAIRAKSLYVSTMTFGLSWGTWENFQYSFRAGGLVLVGQEGFYRSPRLDHEPGPVTIKTSSTNYLTCREINSVTEGKKRTEVASKVEICKLSALEDFE